MELNINQLMEMTGKGFRTIKAALKPLKPVREDGRAAYYEAKEALRLIFGLSDMDQEVLLRERALRRKAEIEVSKLLNELVPLEVMIRLVERDYSVIRTQYLSIASKLAKVLAITSDPGRVQALLQESINEVLEELSADEILRSKKRAKADLKRDSFTSNEGDEASTQVEFGGLGGPVQISVSGSVERSGPVED